MRDVVGRAPEVGAGCELEVLEVLEHAGTCTCTFLHLHSSPTPLELVYIYIYILHYTSIQSGRLSNG